jgi:hypothetical protein
MEMESLENKVEEEGDEDVVNGVGTILPIHTPLFLKPPRQMGDIIESYFKFWSIILDPTTFE